MILIFRLHMDHCDSNTLFLWLYWKKLIDSHVDVSAGLTQASLSGWIYANIMFELHCHSTKQDGQVWQPSEMLWALGPFHDSVGQTSSIPGGENYTEHGRCCMTVSEMMKHLVHGCHRAAVWSHTTHGGKKTLQVIRRLDVLSLFQHLRYSLF